MNKSPQPDRSAEAQRVREELAHDENALRALDAMADQNEGEVDIPPVPDDLRGKWIDRYGEPEAARAKPEENSKVSFFERFSRLLAYGGGATALAAVMVLFAINFSNPDTPPSGGDGPGPVVMRGAKDFVPRADVPVIFIPSEEIPFAEFEGSRQAGKAFQASSVENALELIKEKELDSAVILHAATGNIQPWRVDLDEETTLEGLSENFDAFDLSEAIDGFLNP